MAIEKKSKFCGQFWIYQLNSTANSAYSLQKWANLAEVWKNILLQIRLFFLVRPSSHPYTAHSFISELFDPILHHIQLI